MPPFDSLDPTAYALPAAALARLQSPALVVYLDRVRANLRRVTDLLGGDPDRWRPHVKTIKLPAVFSELARAGLRHFKCATTREAEHLARALAAAGAQGSDVLVAYPLIGPGLARAGQIAAAQPALRFSVLCEDPRAVPDIAPALGIFVDVNPGMNRTGLLPERRDEILAVARRAGPRFRGVHFYDGHLNDADLGLRRRRVFACYDRLLELCAWLERQGTAVGEIVTSGTPSLLSALAYERFAELRGSRHRLSPGTVVYHDLRSELENPGLGLSPAALVLTRVVSHPAPGLVTCDAGSKALAAEAGDPVAHVLGRPDLTPQTPSEEHLPLALTGGDAPARGTPLLLVPRHVCPTVNLAEEALLVESGAVRGAAPVSARAHELLD